MKPRWRQLSAPPKTGLIKLEQTLLRLERLNTARKVKQQGAIIRALTKVSK